MSWAPEVTVAAVLEQNQRFLLVEELIRGQHVLNQPAGRLEPGESLIEAVVRETREETGWHLEPEALVGIYLLDHPGTTRTTLRFAFTGRLLRHDPALPLDQPIVALHWLTSVQIAAAAARWRTPLVMRCVEHYLAGRRLPLQALDHVPGS